MSENVSTDDRSVHNKPHVCCTCGRDLDPEQDAVVYLGYGERHDGKPGPGWVAALCAPTVAQVNSQTGSPCVEACRQWADTNGVELAPATYAEWLGRSDDKPTVRYTGPDLDADHTLAELVGLPTWRLVLLCDWGAHTMAFDSRLASDNAVPMDEWHGHAQAFDVPIMNKADAVQLIAELTPLVGRVCDGYRSEWNGSNHVARFTDGALEALEDLDRAIQDWQPTHIDGAGDLWDAADWFQAEPPTVDASATDTDLAALEAKLQADAHADGLHLHSLDCYLEGLRTEAQEETE